jgi:hypothetical protein
MSEYQLAATELGLLHRRAERGLVDDVSFGRRRDGLLERRSSSALGSGVTLVCGRRVC